MKKTIMNIVGIVVILLVTAVLFTSPANANDSPITIHQIHDGKHYQIMAKQEVVIEALTINDGLCEMSVSQSHRDYLRGIPKQRLPVTLKRGQKITFYDNGDCYVESTTVHTSEGYLIYNWQ